MQNIGMTDKQFNGFLRFIIDDIKGVQEEKDEKREKNACKRF